MTEVRVDGREIAELAKHLRGSSPRLRRSLAVRMRAAGRVVLTDARSRASWSSRIPGAIRLRVATRGSRAGVALRVVSGSAPHARPYEGLTRGGRRGMFRHPVYGNYDAWVSQQQRPFLLPAVKAGRDRVNSEVDQAVDEIAAFAGFRRR